MSSDPLVDLLRWTKAERVKVLDDLDQKAVPIEGQSRRRRARFKYRAARVPFTAQLITGGSGRFVTSARNLSVDGAALLHGAYLHAGTGCRLVLTDAKGVGKVVTGRVVWCRHLSRRLHEFGVAFHEKLDLDQFCPPDARESVGVSAAEQKVYEEKLQLSGNVLLLTADDAERKTLHDALAGAGVSVVAVNAMGQALDQLRRLSFDVMMIDTGLPDLAGEDPMHVLRGAAFKGEVIGLGLPHGRTLADILNGGMYACLSRPVDPASVLLELGRALPAASERDAEAPLYSTLESTDGTSKMIEYFVGQAAQAVRQIEAALLTEQTAKLRSVCQMLKSTATGYGFAPVMEAARHALTALEATDSVAESAAHLRMLLSICRRVRPGTPPKPPASAAPAAAGAKPPPSGKPAPAPAEAHS